MILEECLSWLSRHGLEVNESKIAQDRARLIARRPGESSRETMLVLVETERSLPTLDTRIEVLIEWKKLPQRSLGLFIPKSAGYREEVLNARLNADTISEYTP